MLQALARIEVGGTPAATRRPTVCAAPSTGSTRSPFGSPAADLVERRGRDRHGSGEPVRPLLPGRCASSGPGRALERVTGSWSHTAESYRRLQLPGAVRWLGLVSRRLTRLDAVRDRDDATLARATFPATSHARDPDVVAAVARVGSCPRSAERAGTSRRRRSGSSRGAHAASGRKVLLGARARNGGPRADRAPARPGRPRGGGPCLLAARSTIANCEPERMVRRGEPGKLDEPADERLRVAHADAHVDAPERAVAGESRPRLRAGARRSSSAVATTPGSRVCRSEPRESRAAPRRRTARTFPPGRSGLTTSGRPLVKTNSLRWTCQSPLHVQPMCCPGATVSPVCTTGSMCPYPKWPTRAKPRAPRGVARNTGPPSIANTRCVRPAGAPAPAGRRARRRRCRRGRSRPSSGSGRGSRNEPRIGCWRWSGLTGQPRHESL